MKPELCRAGLAVAMAAFAALIGGCASSPSGTSAPPVIRQPDPPPPIKAPEVSPKDRAALHADLGAGYYERGRMDVAIEELTEAQTLDPTNPRIYNYFGLVYAMLGENAKAEQNFQRALSLAPEDSDVRHNWGWYLCTHGRPRESISEFEAALRNPLYRSPEIALINAGKCSAQAGDAAAADQYLRRALALKPGNPVAAYNLALLSYKNGRFEDARALMRFVMAADPPSSEALYLGMCVERRLADKQSEQSYMAQLRNRYPNSAEARAIATGACE